jgi:hypothetical protein
VFLGLAVVSRWAGEGGVRRAGVSPKGWSEPSHGLHPAADRGRASSAERGGLSLAPRLAGRAEPVRGGFGACGERWGVGAGLPGLAVRPWGGVQTVAANSCVAVGLL